MSESIYVRVCLAGDEDLPNPNRELFFICLMNYPTGVFQVIFCMGMVFVA